MRGMTDAYCYMTYLSPTVMVAAVLLFLLFERMEVDRSARKILKILAPTSFGVYLIHDKVQFTRDYTG